MPFLIFREDMDRYIKRFMFVGASGKRNVFILTKVLYKYDRKLQFWQYLYKWKNL